MLTSEFITRASSIDMGKLLGSILAICTIVGIILNCIFQAVRPRHRHKVVIWFLILIVGAVGALGAVEFIDWLNVVSPNHISACIVNTAACTYKSPLYSWGAKLTLGVCILASGVLSFLSMWLLLRRFLH